MFSIRDRIAFNLKNPQKDVVGWFIANFVFKKKNLFLEENAARLLDIKPDNHVLEIGCGPGFGLLAAHKYIEGGTGKIYGLDLSPYMVELANKRCHQMVRENRMDIVMGNVIQLPYNTDTFHRVFHVNSYYFWPSMTSSLKEIYRVMKPGAKMVATLNLESVKQTESRGLMKYGKTDPLRYMMALEEEGFDDIRIEYVRDGERDFQAIFAEVKEKPAYETEVDELFDRTADNKV